MAWFHLLIHSLYHEILLKDTLKYPLQRRDILLQFMFKQFHELQTVLQGLVTEFRRDLFIRSSRKVFIDSQ